MYGKKKMPPKMMGKPADGMMPQAFKDGGKVKKPAFMKMADGGYACGKAGSLSGKNMKKGSK